MSVDWSWSGCIVGGLVGCLVIGLFFLRRWIGYPSVNREPNEFDEGV